MPVGLQGSLSPPSLSPRHVSAPSGRAAVRSLLVFTQVACSKGPSALPSCCRAGLPVLGLLRVASVHCAQLCPVRMCMHVGVCTAVKPRGTAELSVWSHWMCQEQPTCELPWWLRGAPHHLLGGCSLAFQHFSCHLYCVWAAAGPLCPAVLGTLPGAEAGGATVFLT